MSARLRSLVLAAALLSGTARAEDEVRVFVDGQTPLERGSGPEALVPRAFARSESRFRSGGLVYEKLSAGARLKLTGWLSAQAYFARHDNLYVGKPRRHGNLVVGDLIFQHAFGPFRLLNREGNEWHVTDRYYEYRNLTELLWRTAAPGIALFAYDEFRIDSDDVRVTFNDVGGGIELGRETGALRIFVDREASRRLKPEWQVVRFLGMSFAVRN